MPRLGRLVVLLAAPFVVALGLAGCISSPSTPSASSVPTTSTKPLYSLGVPVPRTTASTTTTSTTSPSTPTPLAVMPCTTTFALATPPPAATLPATVTVSVPADEASYLVVYCDQAGVLEMLGPRGWICKAAYGADWSGGLVLQPAGGELPPAGSAGHLPSTSAVAAIEGFQTGASPVQGAALACPVVPAAAAASRQYLGKSCPPPPAAETLLPASTYDVAFFDPPGTAGTGSPSGGINPANGVVLYEPPGTKSSAYLATCTLPAVQHAVCSTVLQYFASLYD